MSIKPKQERAKYSPRGSGVRVGLGIRLRPELLEALRASGNVSKTIEALVEDWMAQQPKPAPKKAAAPKRKKAAPLAAKRLRT